jgi:hypothetical protein
MQDVRSIIFGRKLKLGVLSKLSYVKTTEIIMLVCFKFN